MIQAAELPLLQVPVVEQQGPEQSLELAQGPPWTWMVLWVPAPLWLPDFLQAGPQALASALVQVLQAGVLHYRHWVGMPAR